MKYCAQQWNHPSITHHTTPRILAVSVPSKLFELARESQFTHTSQNQNMKRIFFVPFSPIQIPLLDSTNLLLCACFLFGFGRSFISFCDIFKTGGIGKNGSTVAVSHFCFLSLSHIHKHFISRNIVANLICMA